MTSMPQGQRVGLAPDYSALRWPGETAETYLLIHGMGDCARIWEPVVVRWPAPRPTFLAPDLPGHGDSAPLPLGDMKSARVAVRLAPTLAELAGPVKICGHSAGARIAIALVRSGAVEARGLSLVDPGGTLAPSVRGRLLAHVALLRRGASSVERLVEAVKEGDPLADPALLTAYFEAAGQAGGAGWHLPVGRGAEALASPDFDLGEALAPVSLPVQVLRGAFSAICTQETAQNLLRAAPDARPLVTIDHAGHAIPMEQPDALAQALADN